LKVAVSCWLFGGTGENRIVKGVGARCTRRAGGGEVVVTGLASTHVALAGPQVVDAAHVKFVGTLEGVLGERGHVAITIRGWGAVRPLLPTEVPALLFEQGVRAARRRLRERV